jgi:hypothetical protein
MMFYKSISQEYLTKTLKFVGLGGLKHLKQLDFIMKAVSGVANASGQGQGKDSGLVRVTQDKATTLDCGLIAAPCMSREHQGTLINKEETWSSQPPRPFWLFAALPNSPPMAVVK